MRIHLKRNDFSYYRQGISRSSNFRNAFLPRSFPGNREHVPAPFLFQSRNVRSFCVPFAFLFRFLIHQNIIYQKNFGKKFLFRYFLTIIFHQTENFWFSLKLKIFKMIECKGTWYFPSFFFNFRTKIIEKRKAWGTHAFLSRSSEFLWLRPVAFLLIKSGTFWNAFTNGIHQDLATVGKRAVQR